jgi:hypothetical protein
MSNVPTTGFSVEVWECRACGKEAPCRVEITHQPTKYPHVEAQPRFTTRNRGCLCDERLNPAWARLSNSSLEQKETRK